LKKSIKIIFLLALAISWAVCIFKLSGMNSENSNGKSIAIISLFIEDTLDITNNYGITSSYPESEKLIHAAQLINAPLRKVIHASVYFVLAFFLMLFLNVIFDYKHYVLSFILILFICVGFAIGDEFHQTFVSGRIGRLLDVAIDSAGAIAGLLFYTTYYFVYMSGYKKAQKELEKAKK